MPDGRTLEAGNVPVRWAQELRCSGPTDARGCGTAEAPVSLNNTAVADTRVPHIFKSIQGPAKREVVNEYTAEFQRELPRGVVASIGYVHRETRQQWGTINTAVALAGWGSPITVTCMARNAADSATSPK